MPVRGGVQGDEMLTPKQEAFCRENRISVDRFWEKVAKAGHEECWNWTAARDGNGYGRFHVGKSHNSAMLAHRVAYGIATGDSPEAVCHRCDNPSCCNPSHLFGGTRADNNRDMTSKGRHAAHTGVRVMPRGHAHQNSKLSPDDVSEMRSLYAGGGVTQYDLARRFGVCQRTVSKLLRGISYA